MGFLEETILFPQLLPAKFEENKAALIANLSLQVLNALPRDVLHVIITMRPAIQLTMTVLTTLGSISNTFLVFCFDSL